jgi:hypothetical protein
MAFEKPAYPDALKRRNWDQNKSLLAKMKGFTGMGEALKKLEDQYDAVKWNEVFDFKGKFGGLNAYAQNGFTVANLDKMAKAAVAEVQSGECSKVRKYALEVRKLATETAAEYDKNALLKKTAKLCREIATEADHFSVAVNINSMSGKIQAAHDEVMMPIKTTLDVLEKDYNRLVIALERGVVPVIQNPSYETWKAGGLMTLCRNLNQVIGNAGKMAAFGCDIGGDAASFKKFFDDMNLYARVDVPFAKDAPQTEVKQHLAALLQLIKRAKALR